MHVPWNKRGSLKHRLDKLSEGFSYSVCPPDTKKSHKILNHYGVYKFFYGGLVIEERRVCNDCLEQTYVLSTSVSVLIAHYAKKHPNFDISPPEEDLQPQPAVTNYLEQPFSLQLSPTQQQTFEDLLVDVFVCDIVPFGLIESPRFISLFRFILGNKYQLISRRTLGRGIQGAYIRKSEVLIDMLRYEAVSFILN
ncbi:hypothetical protein P9112_001777 [Eukaryota sp. TZLM1-RC]